MASANTYSTGNEPRAERHDLALAMPEYTRTNLRPLTKNPLSCRFSQSSLDGERSREVCVQFHCPGSDRHARTAPLIPAATDLMIVLEGLIRLTRHRNRLLTRLANVSRDRLPRIFQPDPKEKIYYAMRYGGQRCHVLCSDRSAYGADYYREGPGLDLPLHSSPLLRHGI
jgi:hypothetical protein